MFNQSKLSELKVRKFKESDFVTFVLAARSNADSIVSFLRDGIRYREFSDLEFAISFNQYVYPITEYEYLGAFFGNELLGMIVLCPPSRVNGSQFVYWVDKNHRNMGIATKMVEVATNHAFSRGHWFVEAFIEDGNLASERIMEKLKFKAVFRYEQDDEEMGRLLKYTIWEKINPGQKSPFGPRRTGFDILKPRRLSIPGIFD
jgi:RimJ/RimL family protein N-acetyltransferase